MNWLSKALPSRERGAALIIVLAFVVLLTGLGVAYLSRTTSDRQVAHSSFNQSNVDQLAQSAMDNVIGDLRQEIVNGSSPSPAPTFSANGATYNLYVPTFASNVLPMRSPMPAPGTTPAIANLIRRSSRTDPALWPDLVVGPARGSRASAVNSLADASANGRSVSLARWNSHYLIPKLNTGDAGSEPIRTGYTDPNYWAPDWVFVNDQGVTVINAADTSVIGRYAYMIYDEGGLLDMNAAGYPSPTTILQYGRKGSLAFTDLSGLPGLSPTPGSTPVDKIVGWRNYASAQASGTFPNFNFSNANSANTYYNLILSDPTNIQLTNYFTNLALTYFTNSFLTTSQAPVFNTQTDQALAARQELLKLRSGVSGGGIGFVNALQSLGTFSREALSKIPQWSPTTPDSVNPNFQTLFVTGPFTRNDGTAASVGEYLVNKRFLLQRLNWLTYKGPSATVANGGTRNAVPTSAPAIGDPDYDLWLLTRGADVRDVNSIRFGLTSAFLQQGTALNVLKYFGLAWDATNERWNYVGHSSSPTPIASIATFGVGGTQAATREPDFFELLKAGILDGSLGDASSPDPALPSVHQASKMLHILTIGANLIAQSRADSYPVRIACNVGGTIMEAVGMPRLPCINSLAACGAGATQAAGGIHWFLIPNLWDPFRDTWDLTEANAGNTGNKPLSTPGYLRPPVRIRIQGSVAFGSVAKSSSVVSGSAQSGVTAFPSGLISIDSNQPLVTGATLNNWHGRDGFLEAYRLRTNDITNGSSLPQFITTNSPTTFFEWDSLTTANMPQAGPGGTQRWIVYRVSLAGSNIPDPSAFTPAQNPVLILQPGFQVTMEYQSPNGSWYPYSFLQGNNASSTWIGNTTPTRNLNLVTDYSIYGKLSGTIPTLLNSSDSATATPWATATLADAPMFAKADPRSIRFNSQIGVLNITSPPMASASAGIVGSLWPDAYTTPTTPTPPPSWTPAPPSFWTMTSPGPTPSPNPNPALYSQTSGDNAAAGTNPYDENTLVVTQGETVRPVMMNRPFRSVGEMGYAFRDQPFRTLSFSSASSPDTGLLDLFTTNDYSDSSGTRGGVVSLNSRQAPALAGMLTSTVRREDTPRSSGAAPGPSPSPLASPEAHNVATSLTLSTLTTPLVNRGGLATLIANETGLGPSVPKTQRESIARALSETVQTRTWNLLIDVIAQSGRYPPNATTLNGFVVNGEQRYWVHVAIDRFTGQVIDKQIEVVNE